MTAPRGLPAGSPRQGVRGPHTEHHNGREHRVAHPDTLVPNHTDFVSWETSGSGLPGDAIFGQKDCEQWKVAGGWANGTCVGGGEGGPGRPNVVLYTRALAAIPY